MDLSVEHYLLIEFQAIVKYAENDAHATVVIHLEQYNNSCTLL